MPKVAVEETLSNVSEYLRNQGYDIVPFRQNTPNENVDAIILSGMDENIMGIMTTSTKIPVINAEGMTAEEVFRRVKDDIPLQ